VWVAVAIGADVDHGYLRLEIVEVTGCRAIPAAMMVYVEHVNPLGAQKGASGRIRAQRIAERVFAGALHIPCGKIVKSTVGDQESNTLIIFLRGGKRLPVDKSPIGDHTSNICAVAEIHGASYGDCNAPSETGIISPRVIDCGG
jgi:hypothetical protein